jgi:peptidoglycan/LPS O-acetylase OafA/YrhL
MTATLSPGWIPIVVALALGALVLFCLLDASRRWALGVATLGCAVGLGVCVGLSFAIYPQTRSGAPLLLAILPIVGALALLMIVLLVFTHSGRVTTRAAAVAFSISALPFLVACAVTAQVIACRFDQCINL